MEGGSAEKKYPKLHYEMNVIIFDVPGGAYNKTPTHTSSSEKEIYCLISQAVQSRAGLLSALASPSCWPSGLPQLQGPLLDQRMSRSKDHLLLSFS